MSLASLVTMSQKYGKNPEYVLAGGGNTSYKEEHFMYVKASGYALKDIDENGFVKLDRAKLSEIFKKQYSDEPKLREAEVLADMMAARFPGEETKRPSVECLLHHVLPYKLVLHLHPTVVGGFVSSVNRLDVFNRLFSEDGIWIPATMPGYILSVTVKNALDKYKEEKKKLPLYIFLENHGVFTGGTTILEVDYRMNKLYEKLGGEIYSHPDDSPCDYNREAAALIAPAVRALTGSRVVSFFVNSAVMSAVSSKESFSRVFTTYSPDHIVYCGTKPLFVEADDVDCAYAGIEKSVRKYIAQNGHAPKIIGVRNLGVFTCGVNKKDSENAKLLYNDAVKVSFYAEAFGGSSPMKDELVKEISGWEVENYRRSVSVGKNGGGRLSGKVALITGAAQGFGKGIAEELAAEGAYIIAADLNEAGAKDAASELCGRFGAYSAYGVGANVGDETQVMNMVYETSLIYGGIDIFVSNAGIVKSGSLEEMQLSTFELMTKVNYTAFFLGAKYCSRIMKIEHRFNPEALFDIIQINSKSGLTGSNRNFAYAGGKFGGIGLVQSFALELVGDGIKVNAVCPGNFFDGPLWSDPVNGLFVQYLKSGKVPGASTVADVKQFYESKVPMKRGCLVKDVARAIYYIVEQAYETGQALPVTGGQVMLS